MRLIKSIIIPGIAAAGLLITSCKKSFLDVNTDPNNPSHATIDLVLPTALGYASYDLGDPMQIIGGLWGQYWTQGPTGSQYIDFDQYLITSSDFNRLWRDMYAGSLNDLK